MQEIKVTLEILNPEFDMTTPPKKKGYKVDGKHGIKKICGLSNLKSVDYLLHKEQPCIIEFSDLIRQLINQNDEIKQIKSSNIPQRLKLKLIKEFHRKLGKELREKFKDTITILNHIPNHFTNIPNWFSTNGVDYKYEIVFLLNNENEDINHLRFLNGIQNDLRSTLHKPTNVISYNIFKAQESMITNS